MIEKAVLIVTIVLSLLACDSGPTSPRGFSLPIGDAAQGEKVFREFNCLACHRMDGFDESAVQQELDSLVSLGGETTRVVTYAELVTSIINPSHKISGIYRAQNADADGLSKMRNYNDVMTVQQLIDLVSFLQPKYSLVPYEPTYYERYR